MKKKLWLLMLIFNFILFTGFMGFNIVNAAEINDSDLVNIPDENLKSMLKYYLGFDETKDITVGDMKLLSELYLRLEYINDLTGLEYAINIEELYLGYNNISDISPLKDLKKLEVLHLNDNNISDLSPLKDLKKLEDLDLNNNNISDISPLAGLINLYELRLANDELEIRDIVHGNNISDISPLKDLKKLEKLNLNNNNISDISPLAGLTNLYRLYLEGNRIYDISALTNMKYIEALNVSGNQIADISSLAELHALQFIDVSYNQIIDTSVLDYLYDYHNLDEWYDYYNFIDHNYGYKRIRLKSENLILNLNLNEIPNQNILREFVSVYGDQDARSTQNILRESVSVYGDETEELSPAHTLEFVKYYPEMSGSNRYSNSEGFWPFDEEGRAIKEGTVMAFLKIKGASEDDYRLITNIPITINIGPMVEELPSEDNVDASFIVNDFLEVILGEDISFGVLEPGSETLDSTTVTVSSSLNYMISAKAMDNFIGKNDESNTIPINKLSLCIDDEAYEQVSLEKKVYKNNIMKSVDNIHDLNFKLRSDVGRPADEYEVDIQIIVESL